MSLGGRMHAQTLTWALFRSPSVQGYLSHKEPPFPRTLQWACAQGLMAVRGGGQVFLMSEVPL